MLTGCRSREQLEAVHEATSLPICVLSPPADIRKDPAFLAANGIKILMLGNPTFAVTVKAIFDSLQHLKDGGPLEGLADRRADPDLLKLVNRTEELLQWQQQYLHS